MKKPDAGKEEEEKQEKERRHDVESPGPATRPYEKPDREILSRIFSSDFSKQNRPVTFHGLVVQLLIETAYSFTRLSQY